MGTHPIFESDFDCLTDFGHLKTPLNIMGRVRTKTVKKASRRIIEKYYMMLTLDFHTNKRVIEEIAIIPTKRLRNQIGGFITHLMKRIRAGPVRGISIKLQEEERERRDNYVPEISAIENEELLEVDAATQSMIKALEVNGKESLLDSLKVVERN